MHLSQAGGANSMQVGSLYTEATFSESWQFVELTFDAPTNSALLTEIILTPYTTGSNMSDPDSTYAGLDSLNLGAVPEPTSFVAVGAGFAVLVRWGKRKGGSRS